MVPLDRETLLASFDGIRQFAQGGRRAPHKPLLLLYALARLKHDRQAEIRFNTTEAALQPLLRVYGPWGASARVSYPYSRLVGDGLWQLPDRAALLDAGGNIREGIARERDAPAGFTPDVLATFEGVCLMSSRARDSKRPQHPTKESAVQPGLRGVHPQARVVWMSRGMPLSR